MFSIQNQRFASEVSVNPPLLESASVPAAPVLLLFFHVSPFHATAIQSIVCLTISMFTFESYAAAWKNCTKKHKLITHSLLIFISRIRSFLFCNMGKIQFLQKESLIIKGLLAIVPQRLIMNSLLHSSLRSRIVGRHHGKTVTS